MLRPGPVSSPALHRLSIAEIILRDQEARDWFTNLHETVLEVAPRRHTTKEERIKIAVLDTGVQQETFENWLQQRQIRNRVSYTSFVNGDSGYPPCDDADHGTHIAALLLRTAPNADVLIARVANGTSIEAADSITKVRRFHGLRTPA